MVFYFHGAGVTNCVWAPDGAALLEVTLLIDGAQRRPWRGAGHLVVDAIPSLRWFLHGIPLYEGVDVPSIEKALNVAPISEALFENYDVADMYLQNTQRVINIPDGHLTNLAWLANTLNNNRASAMSLGGPFG